MLETFPFDIPCTPDTDNARYDSARYDSACHDGAPQDAVPQDAMPQDAMPLRPLVWAELSARFAAARDLRCIMPTTNLPRDMATASFGQLTAPGGIVPQTLNSGKDSINHYASANGKPATLIASDQLARNTSAMSKTISETGGVRDR